MKLLPKDQWAVAIQDGHIHLSAWANGPDEDYRYWVKFVPSRPFDDRLCLEDLKGVCVDIPELPSVA
jgi:hypothetical protein